MAYNLPVESPLQANVETPDTTEGLPRSHGNLHNVTQSLSAADPDQTHGDKLYSPKAYQVTESHVQWNLAEVYPAPIYGPYYLPLQRQAFSRREKKPLHRQNLCALEKYLIIFHCSLATNELFDRQSQKPMYFHRAKRLHQVRWNYVHQGFVKAYLSKHPIRGSFCRKLPEANKLPSGEKARQRTQSVCPVSV